MVCVRGYDRVSVPGHKNAEVRQTYRAALPMKDTAGAEDEITPRGTAAGGGLASVCKDIMGEWEVSQVHRRKPRWT